MIEDEKVEEQEVVEEKMDEDRFKNLVEKRMEKKYNDTINELTNKLTEFEADKEEKERAKKTKLENLEADMQVLSSEKETLLSTIEGLKFENLKTSWIYENAPQSLPKIYKSQVTGTTEEELKESLDLAVAQFESDFNSIKEETEEKKVSIGSIPPEKKISTAGKEIKDMTLEEYAIYTNHESLK